MVEVAALPGHYIQDLRRLHLGLLLAQNQLMQSGQLEPIDPTIQDTKLLVLSQHDDLLTAFEPMPQ